MKFIILLAAILTVVVGQGDVIHPFQVQNKDNPQSKVIINGNIAAAGQITYQVLIRMANNLNDTVYTSICGGSLLNELFVLTAGHCVYGRLKFYLGFGSISAQAPLKVVISTVAYIHPQYNPNNFNNDVALIKLPSIMSYNTANIYPIRLPTKTQLLAGTTFAGLTARVSGWGRTSTDGPYAPSLKYVDLKVITNAACTTYFNQFVISSTLCASGITTPIDAFCYGDSGGPLAIKEGTAWTLIGAVSFISARAGCTQGYPSGFARVTSFMPWIQTMTGIQFRP